MDIGVFQLLPRGRAATDREVVEQALWEVDFAERHGFESVWVTEHHVSGYGSIGVPSVVEGSTTRGSAHRITSMIRLLVLYGQPKDPAAFDQYYHETHVPIARRMKGLKKWTIGKVQGTPDGKPAPFYYVADLYMESRADFEQLLASPEGQAAVADVPNYATGGATFLYTEVKDVI